MTTEWGKQKYGWSKYSGGFMGLVKDENDWYCQACGEPQAKELPQYMLPISKMEREYVRICSVCKHIQLRHKIGKYNFVRIIQIVRKQPTYG